MSFSYGSKHPPASSPDAETTFPKDNQAMSRQLAWDIECRRLKRALEIKDEVIDNLTSNLELTREAKTKAVKRYERALEYTIEVEEKLDHLREEFAAKLKEKEDELRNMKVEKDARIVALSRENEELSRIRDEIVRDLSSRLHVLDDQLLEMVNRRDSKPEEAAKTTEIFEEELSGVNGVACNQKSQSPDYIQVSSSDNDEISCHGNASSDCRSDQICSTSHKQKVPAIRGCKENHDGKWKTPGLEGNDCTNVLECLAHVTMASEKDVQLCAQDVSAQHRSGLLSSEQRGYENRDIDRGGPLSEYLVDGDPNSDEKSANVLKHQEPGRVNSCRKLALISMTKSHKKAVDQSMKMSSSVILKRARKILDNWTTDKVSHKRVKTMKTQPILSTEERQQSLKVNIPHPVKEPIMCSKFTTKCRPRGLVELINHLNPKQMEAVRQIGFGGLLHVKVTYMPQGILPWLIDAFCDRSHMFKISATKEFLLSKDDVHDFFGLPRGPKKVDLVATGNSKLSSQENLKSVWRRKFGIVGTKDVIPLSKVLAKLLNSKDIGVEFKRLFVLYTMSSFLAPTSNHALDLKLLRAVQDVGEIRQLDWCSYVFDNLVTAMQGCRTGRSNVCGCTLFLMLAYFHRFDFRGEVQPFSLPLIQHWTDEKLSDRVNRESQTGCLGNAPLSQVLYPICVNGHPTNAESKVNDAQPSRSGVHP